jgi:hypothetical protein
VDFAIIRSPRRAQTIRERLAMGRPRRRPRHRMYLVKRRLSLAAMAATVVAVAQAVGQKSAIGGVPRSGAILDVQG